MKKISMRWWLTAVLLAGCAGTQRECSSCNASSFGSDWVIVQRNLDNRPTHCWMLHNVSSFVDNESHSDGIYWQSADGHLVHLSNMYVRVKVANGDWAGALHEVGMTRESCLSANVAARTP